MTYTDWSLTLGGVVLVTLGGFGMAWAAQMNLREGWLLWGQLLFLVSGIMWLARLVPIQIAQAALIPVLAHEGAVSALFRAAGSSGAWPPRCRSSRPRT